MSCQGLDTETSQTQIKALGDIRLLLPAVVMFSRDLHRRRETPVGFVMADRPHESAGLPPDRVL